MGAAAAADNEQVLIGRCIKAWREHLDVTQGELARRLEIDRRQLSDWERGVVKAPSIHNLRRIALRLGITLDQLVEGPA